ncbi:MAG TPA: hypothetical protein ENJ42_00835 [Hellea balneolensis]|uniref:Uncharacterized protein n=1 Tax=Hellea balneolensis TaxID=287478 RepID=A0A7C5LRI9_9PROT|nr:hypothetical protein [Hellea balneolensis]
MDVTTVQDAIDQIPPDAWPLIENMLRLTLIVTGVWLALNIFIFLRRRASNLTPVHAARKNKKAEPDFLSVDKKARKSALKRGEGLEKDLDRRDKDEQRAARRAARAKMSAGQRIASLVSFLMSFFTLATMIYGAIFQVSRMGQLMQEYSTMERISTVVKTHPVSVSIASLVIIYHIYRFVSGQKWKEG